MRDLVVAYLRLSTLAYRHATMHRMRWSPFSLAVIAALLLLAACLIATEVAIPSVARFWAGHPLSATLVMGLTLLGLGYFGLEAWVRRREVLQWKLVRSLAYRALVQELGDIRRRMSQLVSAREDPYDDGLRVDRYRREQLLEILRRYPEIERIGGHPGQGLRLAHLLDDWDYAKAFNRRVIELKRDYYTAIASWSPLMLQTPDLAADLDALARVGQELVELERRLYERHSPLRRELTEWQPDDEWKERVIDGFRRVRKRAYEVQMRFESKEKAAFPWHDRSHDASRPERSLADENRSVDGGRWDS